MAVPCKEHRMFRFQAFACLYVKYFSALRAPLLVYKRLKKKRRNCVRVGVGARSNSKVTEVVVIKKPLSEWR